MKALPFFFLGVLATAAASAAPDTTPPAAVPPNATYTQSGEDLMRSAEKILFKKTPQEDLHLYVLRPAHLAPGPLPAIVYFAGGGWVNESVAAQIPVAAWFRDHGLIAITADYRVKNRNGTSPLECVRDAKSALRYVRAHARELGIDPHRIIAAGGSAGGHIAACTAIAGGDEPGEDLNVSARGDALVLHNPVLGEGFGAEFFAAHPELSPVRLAGPDWPPTILSCGTKDALTPHHVAEKFAAALRSAGVPCELVSVQDAPHSCDWPVSNPNFLPTIQRMTAFLQAHGFVP